MVAYVCFAFVWIFFTCHISLAHCTHSGKQGIVAICVVSPFDGVSIVTERLILEKSIKCEVTTKCRPETYGDKEEICGVVIWVAMAIEKFF